MFRQLFPQWPVETHSFILVCVCVCARQRVDENVCVCVNVNAAVQLGSLV